MINTGTKIKNIRTNAIGTLIGYKDVWVNRHYVKKAIVSIAGEPDKLWATSSLKEVDEEHAPRAIVRLRNILKSAKANENKVLPLMKQRAKENFSTLERFLTCSIYQSQHLHSLQEIQELEPSQFLSMLLAVEFLTSNVEHTELAGVQGLEGLESFGDCGRFTSELTRLYMGYK